MVGLDGRLYDLNPSELITYSSLSDITVSEGFNGWPMKRWWPNEEEEEDDDDDDDGELFGRCEGLSLITSLDDDEDEEEEEETEPPKPTPKVAAPTPTSR